MGLEREAHLSKLFENDGCHTPWEEHVWMATLSAIHSSQMPRSLSPPFSTLSDVIVTKTGNQVREQRARDEKSTLSKRSGETSRWVIPSATSLSKLIGSNSDVLTSAAAFEKGWDNTTSSCKGSSAAFMPWSTSPESSDMSIAYFGLWLRYSRWWNQAFQRWLTVHAVSGTRKWKSPQSFKTAKRRWRIIRIDS